MKYIKRIIALPFWIGIISIHLIFLWLKFIVSFVLYGGEAIAYESKNSPKKISQVYYKLEKEMELEKLDDKG